MSRRALGAVLAVTMAMSVLVGCSSGDDTASGDSTSTTTADSASTTAEGADATDSGEATTSLPPLVPEDTTTITPAELAKELEAPTADGDMCGIAAVFQKFGTAPADGDAYLESLQVTYEALTKIVPSTPPELAAALEKLLAGTEQVLALLKTNGADLSDPALANLQSDPDLAEGQAGFENWIRTNCQ